MDFQIVVKCWFGIMSVIVFLVFIRYRFTDLFNRGLIK